MPTYKCYQTVNQDFATVFFHWFLLVQPPPFPETMLGNSAELFLKTMLFRLGGELDLPVVDQPAYNEYLRCFRDPAAIRALCEDYRAAASIDLAHDKEDLNKKIECPFLVLWSEKGPFHRMYDVLQTWKERSIQVGGKALPTGHFLPPGTSPRSIDRRAQTVFGSLIEPAKSPLLRLCRNSVCRNIML